MIAKIIDIVNMFCYNSTIGRIETVYIEQIIFLEMDMKVKVTGIEQLKTCVRLSLSAQNEGKTLLFAISMKPNGKINRGEVWRSLQENGVTEGDINIALADYQMGVDAQDQIEAVPHASQDLSPSEYDYKLVQWDDEQADEIEQETEQTSDNVDPLQGIRNDLDARAAAREAEEHQVQTANPWQDLTEEQKAQRVAPSVTVRADTLQGIRKDLDMRAAVRDVIENIVRGACYSQKEINRMVEIATDPEVTTRSAIVRRCHSAVIAGIATRDVLMRQQTQPAKPVTGAQKFQLAKEWEYVETSSFDTPILDLGNGIKIFINFAMDPIADTGDYERSAYVEMHTKNGNTDTIQFIIANNVMRVLGDIPFFGSDSKECDEVAVEAVNATIQDLIDAEFSEVLRVGEVQS